MDGFEIPVEQYGTQGDLFKGFRFSFASQVCAGILGSILDSLESLKVKS